MRRLPPALAATATPRILELLGDGPGRVLELAGWEVVVVEVDPTGAEQARQRGARVVEHAEGGFDAVVAPTGADLTGIDAAKIVLVDERGRASMAP